MSSVTFILHKPQLSENIGACARAIKNFNFNKLAVINPKPLFPNDKIVATSVGAKEIIKNCKVYDNLELATKNIDYLIATSSRFRNKNIKHINLKDLSKLDFNKKIGFLFGSEASGLSNNEIIYANCTMHIPTNPNFKSINLSHAVQIVAHEIHKESLSDPYIQAREVELATSMQKEKLMEHIELILDLLDFYDHQNPKQVPARLTRLIKRMQLDKLEIGILRGILSKLEDRLNK